MTPPELTEDLLSAYVDEELDPDTRAAVDARLAESSDWRAVLLEVRAARDAVRALPRLTLSPSGWDEVLEAVTAADRPTETSPASVVRLRSKVTARRVRWATAAGLAAAAAIVAALLLPTPRQVTPKVATFSTEQSARASVGGDPVSALAGVGLTGGLGR